MTMDRSGAHEKSTSPDAAIGESLDAANTGQCEPGCGSDRSQPLPVTAPTWAEAQREEAEVEAALVEARRGGDHAAMAIAIRERSRCRHASDLALVREVIRRTNSGAAYLTSTLDSFAASVLAEIERGE